MSVFAAMREENKSTEAAVAPATHAHNAFGMVLNISTATVVDNSLVLTGKTLTNNAQLPEGSEVKVMFRNDSAGRSVSNFTKGNGKSSLATPEAAAGTFVTLESCYPTGVNDGPLPVLSARWLNTLASVNNPDHHNRSFVENILASAPRLIYDNPDPKPGEPRSITLPVNAAEIQARVEGDGGRQTKATFSREWAVEKLKALPKGKKPQVVIDTLEPSESAKATSLDSLQDILRQQLARGTKALSMIRVADSDEVLTRLVYVPFKRVTEGTETKFLPDVDTALDDLLRYPILRGIPNDALGEAIVEGKVVAEVIPGYRMTYAGDTSRDDNAAFKLVQDVCNGRDARNRVLFGNEPANYAKVILTGLCRTEAIDGFSPTNIMTEESGSWSPTEIVTPHIQPQVAMQDRPASDEEQSEEAPRP